VVNVTSTLLEKDSIASTVPRMTAVSPNAQWRLCRSLHLTVMSRLSNGSFPLFPFPLHAMAVLVVKVMASHATASREIAEIDFIFFGLVLFIDLRSP